MLGDRRRRWPNNILTHRGNILFPGASITQTGLIFMWGFHFMWEWKNSNNVLITTAQRYKMAKQYVAENEIFNEIELIRIVTILFTIYNTSDL